MLFPDDLKNLAIKATGGKIPNQNKRQKMWVQGIQNYSQTGHSKCTVSLQLHNRLAFNKSIKEAARGIPS